MIRFVDLFAGIGGLRLGFEQACQELHFPTKCVLSSEIEPHASKTYEMNFKQIPAGDIRKIYHFPDFYFLLAGFPCQPFSYAGKHEGFADTRGTLFFEIERVLKSKRPTAFLLENVRGLVTHDKGRTFKTTLNKLQEQGYSIKYLLLNSSNYNVPQNRVRLYLIGTLGKTPTMTLLSDVGAPDSHKYKLHNARQTLLTDGFTRRKLVRDILEENPDRKYDCSPSFIELLSRVVDSKFNLLNGVRLIDYRNGNSVHSWQLGIKGECTKEEIEFMDKLIANRRKKIFGTDQDGKKLTLEQIKTFYDKPNIVEITESLIKKGYLTKTSHGKFNPTCGNMSFEIFKFLDPDSISITLTSSDAHKLGIVQNNKPRHLTPRECARLQGFPDSFLCHPNDRYAYMQFGNSVSVPVVKEVMLNFLANNQKICCEIESK